MNVKFKVDSLETLYKTSLKEIKGKQNYPEGVIKQFKVKILILVSIKNISELRAFRSLRFKKLQEKKYEGKYSIRLNRQYRLVFEQIKEKTTDKIMLQVLLIHEISKHYE